MATTAEDVDAIGKKFAAGYYKAFVAKPGADGDFYDDKSVFVFMQHGRRPDFEAKGADAIGRFAGRMNYGECTVNLASVETIKVRIRNRDRFAVLTVGTLARPGRPLPRKFVQSTVIRYAPSSSRGRTFSVVGTVFKYDDDTVVDDGPFELDDVEPTNTTVAVSENRRPDDEDPGDPAGDVTTLPPKANAEREPAKTTATWCGSAGEPDGSAVNDGVPNRQLYVSGFPKHVQVDDLKTSFGRFGALKDVEIYQCPKRTGRPAARRYAIVRFENPERVDVVAGMKIVPLENGDQVIVEKSTRTTASK